jgi:putative flippase GtrA
MESPAAPAAQLTQQSTRGQATREQGSQHGNNREQPGRGAPGTRHYRGILRYPVVRQLLRFTGVGIICTAASLALYALLRPWLGPQLANAAALVLTSFMNTALNRRLTFKITDQHRMARDHLHGLAVIAVALVITGSSLGILHWVHPEATVADELWTTTLSGFLATAVRFTMLRHWIFRRARHR